MSGEFAGFGLDVEREAHNVAGEPCCARDLRDLVYSTRTLGREASEWEWRDLVVRARRLRALMSVLYGGRKSSEGGPFLLFDELELQTLGQETLYQPHPPRGYVRLDEALRRRDGEDRFVDVARLTWALLRALWVATLCGAPAHGMLRPQCIFVLLGEPADAARPYALLGDVGLSLLIPHFASSRDASRSIAAFAAPELLGGAKGYLGDIADLHAVAWIAAQCVDLNAFELQWQTDDPREKVLLGPFPFALGASPVDQRLSDLLRAMSSPWPQSRPRSLLAAFREVSRIRPGGNLIAAERRGASPGERLTLSTASRSVCAAVRRGSPEEIDTSLARLRAALSSADPWGQAIDLALRAARAQRHGRMPSLWRSVPIVLAASRTADAVGAAGLDPDPSALVIAILGLACMHRAAGHFHRAIEIGRQLLGSFCGEDDREIELPCAALLIDCVLHSGDHQFHDQVQQVLERLVGASTPKHDEELPEVVSLARRLLDHETGGTGAVWSYLAEHLQRFIDAQTLPDREHPTEPRVRSPDAGRLTSILGDLERPWVIRERGDISFWALIASEAFGSRYRSHLLAGARAEARERKRRAYRCYLAALAQLDPQEAPLHCLDLHVTLARLCAIFDDGERRRRHLGEAAVLAARLRRLPRYASEPVREGTRYMTSSGPLIEPRRGRDPDLTQILGAIERSLNDPAVEHSLHLELSSRLRRAQALRQSETAAKALVLIEGPDSLTAGSRDRLAAFIVDQLREEFGGMSACLALRSPAGVEVHHRAFASVGQGEADENRQILDEEYDRIVRCTVAKHRGELLVEPPGCVIVKLDINSLGFATFGVTGAPFREYRDSDRQFIAERLEELVPFMLLIAIRGDSAEGVLPSQWKSMAFVAHDCKRPINWMLRFWRSLDASARLDADQRDSLLALIRIGYDMVQAHLSLTHAWPLEPVRLGPFLTNQIEQWQTVFRLLGHTALPQLEQEPGPMDRPLRIRSQALRIILSELIENSRKYTCEDGPEPFIRCTVRVAPRQSSSLYGVRIALTNAPMAQDGDLGSSRLGRTIVHYLVHTLDDGKVIHDGPLRGAVHSYKFEFEFSAAVLPEEKGAQYEDSGIRD